MNNSYIGYFKNRFPIKFLTNIFRNYKKSTEQVQTNTEKYSKPPQRSLIKSLPKKTNCQLRPEVRNISEDMSAAPETSISSICDNKKAPPNLILNLSNKEPENSLKLRKCSQIDSNIRKKVEKIPISDMRKCIFEFKNESNKVYPWQNFNVDDVYKPKYKIIKPVSNVTKEIINMKKPVPKKIDFFKPMRSKEIKLNKNPTLMIFPKLNNTNSICLHSQPRINLSTTSTSVIRKKSGVNLTLVNLQKVGSESKMKPPCRYQARVNTKVKIKYFPKGRRFLCHHKRNNFCS